MGKRLLLVIVVLLVIAGGVIYARSKGYLGGSKSEDANTNGKDDATQRYLSFGGDYLFVLPSGYIIDDASIPGAQLILKQDEKLQVKTIDEIYAKGALALQPFSPALTDEESFKNYVNKTLVNAIQESLKGLSVVSYGKQDGYVTAKISTNVDGKLVRVQYIVNSDKPVIIASGDESSVYKTISDSIAVASKSNLGFSEIQNTIMTCSSLLKNRMSEDLYRLGSKTFKDQTTSEKLKTSLDSANVALDSNIAVSGGVLTADKFSASLLFTKPATKASEQARNAVGTINFEKEDGQWKVSGITLPQNEAFTASAEE